LCHGRQSRATCQGACSKEAKKVRKSQKKEAMPELGLLKAQQSQVKCDRLPKAAPKIQTADVPPKETHQPLVRRARCPTLFGEKGVAKFPSNKLRYPLIQKIQMLGKMP
jgi:hypothetical protein